jgi:hypothetical protein
MKRMSMTTTGRFTEKARSQFELLVLNRMSDMAYPPLLIATIMMIQPNY